MFSASITKFTFPKSGKHSVEQAGSVGWRKNTWPKHFKHEKPARLHFRRCAGFWAFFLLNAFFLRGLFANSSFGESLLYHNKKCQGTTTCEKRVSVLSELYHSKKCQGTTTSRVRLSTFSGLYHNKKCQGTTTNMSHARPTNKLYHNKKCQGTTTTQPFPLLMIRLYHNKKCQGTTT